MIDLFEKRSATVECMMHSSTDFINNMYDVMLLCWNPNAPTSGYINFFHEFYKSTFIGGSKGEDPTFPRLVGNGDMFMVRVAGIDIPQMESDTFNMRFGIHNIKKVRSKVKFERRAELKVFMDEPMYLMKIFNLVSNNNRTVFDGKYRNKETGLFRDSNTKVIEEKRIIEERYEEEGGGSAEEIIVSNFFPKGLAAFSTNMLNNDLINKMRIDLVVKHQKLLTNRELELDDLNMRLGLSNNNPKVISQFNLRAFELPLWYFEDIKFLGQADAITFDRDGGSSSVETTFPFLFKRCIRIDRQFRRGSLQGYHFQSISNVDAAMRHLIEDSTLSTYFFRQSDQDWTKPR